ncbi:glycosyltransferase [Kaistella polysaccharea]|uniref:glycosyltransferase n=1 Tax=Kaistella polysaccharea TaxID=2878534 RepID=UPI001CF1E244|nr:glycosyltransferase [Kaistella polysaccharea]
MLAIIIPYFKLTFFRKTLHSLAEQTNKRFHVYIGNDASLENPEKLLKEFTGKFNFTYKSFDTNLGGTSLVKQWERCIALSNDEKWLMILGDDDVMGNNVVEEFYEAIATFGGSCNVVRNASVLINENEETISKIYKNPLYEDAIASYCKKLKGDSRGSLSEYIYRMKSYKKYGFRAYDMAWGSDDRAVIDFSEGKPIYSTDAVVYVRMSAINISGNTENVQEKIDARLEVTKDLLQDYRHVMTQDQIKTFVDLYEFLIYKSNKLNIEHFFYFMKISIKYFGLPYSIKILKSSIHKLYSRK